MHTETPWYLVPVAWPGLPGVQDQDRHCSHHSGRRGGDHLGGVVVVHRRAGAEACALGFPLAGDAVSLGTGAIFALAHAQTWASHRDVSRDHHARVDSTRLVPRRGPVPDRERRSRPPIARDGYPSRRLLAPDCWPLGLLLHRRVGLPYPAAPDLADTVLRAAVWCPARFPRLVGGVPLGDICAGVLRDRAITKRSPRSSSVRRTAL